MQFRLYLDSVEETLSYYDSIDEPYEYVKYTPLLFNKWFLWAKSYKHKDEDSMRPMGAAKLGPDWMRGDFESINSFYEFFIETLEFFKKE